MELQTASSRSICQTLVTEAKERQICRDKKERAVLLGSRGWKAKLSVGSRDLSRNKHSCEYSVLITCPAQVDASVGDKISADLFGGVFPVARRRHTKRQGRADHHCHRWICGFFVYLGAQMPLPLPQCCTTNDDGCCLMRCSELLSGLGLPRLVMLTACIDPSDKGDASHLFPFLG